MLGERARIGTLVPPGTPTEAPELYRMAPAGAAPARPPPPLSFGTFCHLESNPD